MLSERTLRKRARDELYAIPDTDTDYGTVVEQFFIEGTNVNWSRLNVYVPLLSATILAQALLDHFPQLFFGLVPPHCKLCPPRSRRLLMTSFA